MISNLRLCGVSSRFTHSRAPGHLQALHQLLDTVLSTLILNGSFFLSQHNLSPLGAIYSLGSRVEVNKYTQVQHI